tara:strand:- start:260 stop:607 length:348 start_codon:yes stop_codon:yes gene_type:complete
MGEMFSGTTFNGDISNWNVSNVNNMGEIFENSKFDGDISKWVNKPIEPSLLNHSENDCSFRDETFIKNKMKKLNNDVISIQKVGKRKYFVQYVNWNTGLGVSGQSVLDYSNLPCN